MKYLPYLLLLLLACGDDSGPSATDSGTDASAAPSDAGLDAGESPDAATQTDSGLEADGGNTGDAATDAGIPDGGISCIDDGHTPGERIETGDRCNFCECTDDGTWDCTDRSCVDASLPGCEYHGTMHGYGERFDATDGCNTCVCAASGLACTRREACPSIDEGAILLDSLDEECGIDGFTPNAVLAGLPHSELRLPFVYDMDRPPAHYPETLPDTEITVRILRDQAGYAVCRIPSAGQEAIDMEVLVEWYTADGAFDETFHAYLRRNAGGFTDVWTSVASLPAGSLNGSYDPGCPDSRGLSFNTIIDADGSARGSAHKSCEVDLLFEVGSFSLEAP